MTAYRTKIQHRRDTATNWIAENPVLADGEFGIDSTSGGFKIGDGVSAWTSLSYFTGVAGSDPTVASKIAEGVVSIHRIVRSINGTEVQYADVTNVNHVWSVLGVAMGSAADGDALNVKTEGEITEPSWTWTPTLPIYLTVNGQMSQTPPTPPTAAFVLCVGYALTATTMRVQIGLPIILA